MTGYTPDQKARIDAAFKEAVKGQRRPRRNRYQRAAEALNAIADDFRGADRDAISHVISLLEDEERPAGKYAVPGDEDF